MADQEKNFRTSYYEKVGFRAVEEKKSIEILLKDQPIRRDKLEQFCVKFGLPAVYRQFVWKILLGILPFNQTNQDFAWFHRQEQVKELERAAILLSPEIIDGTQEQKILRMKLIEEGTIPMESSKLDSLPEHQAFLSIIQTVSGLVNSEVDLFWISTRFYRHIHQHLYKNLSQYPDLTMQCLRKEDKDQKLYRHLCQHHVIDALPLSDWFQKCFATVLPETSVERIWDRVICGLNHILVFVAVAVLLVLKRPLLTIQSKKDLMSFLKQIPEDCGDRIVNEAIDMLQKNAGKLPFKEDSPVLTGGETGRNSSKSLPDSNSTPSSRSSSGRSGSLSTPSSTNMSDARSRHMSMDGGAPNPNTNNSTGVSGECAGNLVKLVGPHHPHAKSTSPVIGGGGSGQSNM